MRLVVMFCTGILLKAKGEYAYLWEEKRVLCLLSP